ncbi:hypothetical protein PWT90_09472 [Aphanocladium album]|nr:hypothetical protein PWT90_09472 [Aphanocladium album]
MASSVAKTLPVLSTNTIATLIADLALPQPTAIEPLHATAAFHSIYLVHFAGAEAASITSSSSPRGSSSSPNDDDEHVAATLVLRVSGRDIPRVKTANEVAVLRWLAARTAIPVPAVVRFDVSTDNALGREFTLLTRVPGRSVDTLYAELTEAAKVRLVAQLTDVLVELNGHAWTHVGGLQLDDRSGDVVPGPVLEDTFWMEPDMETYWGGEEEEESLATLNPTGPYESHAELVRAFLRVYAHAIDKHTSLAWLRDDLRPRLEALAAGDTLPEAQLAATRLVLAHKDLHFANVMAAPDGTLTGILDWEFAGVVPALRWDPVRAFLWNGRRDEASGAEKERMRVIFEKMLEERGIDKWWEQGVSDEVTDVWTVLRFTRALVEVCPRGQRAELVNGWRDEAMAALTKLGV